MVIIECALFLLRVPLGRWLLGSPRRPVTQVDTCGLSVDRDSATTACVKGNAPRLADSLWIETSQRMPVSRAMMIKKKLRDVLQLLGAFQSS